ncbi:MAG: metallophosphoesterase family protein [Bacilli bacterium]
METDLINKFRYLAQKKFTIEKAIDSLDISETEILFLLSTLRHLGENITLDNGVLTFDKPNTKETKIHTSKHPQDLKICFISDTHLCTTFERLDILNYIYEKCEYLGIKNVFFCGDLVDGTDINSRKNYHQAPYLIEDSFSGQLQYVDEHFPYFSGLTYMINGNHDLRWKHEVNRNIIEELSLIRNDIVYLGDDRAIANINGIRIFMAHQLRKELNNLPNNIDIIQGGHLHSSRYYEYNQIPCFQTAALINFPPYLQRSTAAVERSCWFLGISIDDDNNIYYIDETLETFNKKTLKKQISYK